MGQQASRSRAMSELYQAAGKAGHSTARDCRRLRKAKSVYSGTEPPEYAPVFHNLTEEIQDVKCDLLKVSTLIAL